MSDKIPGWIPMHDFPVSMMSDHQAKVVQSKDSNGDLVYTFQDNKGRERTIHGEVQHGVPPWMCEDDECLAVWWDEEWDSSKCPACGCEVTS